MAGDRAAEGRQRRAVDLCRGVHGHGQRRLGDGEALRHRGSRVVVNVAGLIRGYHDIAGSGNRHDAVGDRCRAGGDREGHRQRGGCRGGESDGQDSIGHARQRAEADGLRRLDDGDRECLHSQGGVVLVAAVGDGDGMRVDAKLADRDGHRASDQGCRLRGAAVDGVTDRAGGRGNERERPGQSGAEAERLAPGDGRAGKRGQDHGGSHEAGG